MGPISRTLLTGVGLATLLRLIGSAMGADLPEAMPVKASPLSAAYDWIGFYLGGHIGYALGNSNFTCVRICRVQALKAVL